MGNTVPLWHIITLKNVLFSVFCCLKLIWWRLFDSNESRVGYSVCYCHQNKHTKQTHTVTAARQDTIFIHANECKSPDLYLFIYYFLLFITYWMQFWWKYWFNGFFKIWVDYLWSCWCGSNILIFFILFYYNVPLKAKQIVLLTDVG